MTDRATIHEISKSLIPLLRNGCYVQHVGYATLDVSLAENAMYEAADYIELLDAELATLRARVELADALYETYYAMENDSNEETEQEFLDALDAYGAAKSSKVTK